ncbi:MAG TPA: stalk domain-containing protein [Ruminiclostridium sp.]
MKKLSFMKGLLSGVLIAALLITCMPSLASTVEFILNSVNLTLDSKQIAKKGDGFYLSNGEKVPFSINYKGTTYLPVKKLAETLGSGVTWDGTTQTVGLISNNLQSPVDASSADPINVLSGRAALMPQYGNSDGYVIRVAANKQKGFNRPYYLYIPNNLDKSNGNYIIAETANVSIHDEKVTDLLTGKDATQAETARLAVATNSVYLLAAFERPKTGPYAYVYTSAYSRSAISIGKDSELYRLDLQLESMINDAKDILKYEGIAARDKVFAYGFSASSHFMNAFTILHPELIQAIATGGINSLPIVPLKEYQGEKLRYPIGVNDIKELTNIDFDFNTYKKVPQFIFMGGLDTNDTAPFGDCYEPQDTEQIYRLLGEKMVPDRFNKMKTIFDSIGVNATFKLYPDVGHWGLSGSIFNEVKSFLNNNKVTTPINVPKNVKNAFPTGKVDDPYKNASLAEYETTPEYNDWGGSVVRVNAKPNQGFNRAYYMYIPNNLNYSSKIHIMFETPNLLNNSKEAYYYITGDNITQCAGTDIARSINSITVMPAIERPDSGELAFVYTHALTRQTMLIKKSSELYRIDLQMEAMLKDAKLMLQKYNKIKVEDKIFITGFSASAQLATRYIMLHPENIQAAVMGGIAIPMQPYKSYNKQILNYPLGINDFNAITGSNPNLAAYKKIPQFYYIGDNDFNDPAPYSDSFDPGFEQIIYKSFGKIQVPDRFTNAMKALQASGADVSYKIVPNTDHEGTKGILSEIVDFFNKYK